MPRSFRYNKGQWFLISAVIASGIFLSISFLLRDYFSAQPDDNKESLYFDAIKNGLMRTVQLDCERGGGVFNSMSNLTDYMYFAGQKMASLGYLLNVTPKRMQDIVCPGGMGNFYVMILKSSDADIWDGTRPKIQNIDNSENDRFLINLAEPMPYPFSINASVYSPSGRFLNSVIKNVPNGNSVAVRFSELGLSKSQASYTIINSIHIIGKTRWELL